MYDNRGTSTYKNIAYTTALIDDICWMTRDLDLPGGTSLTSSNSNVSSNYTLPASQSTPTVCTIYDTDGCVYNSGGTNCNSNTSCYSEYSWQVAVAGTNVIVPNTATYDICKRQM